MDVHARRNALSLSSSATQALVRVSSLVTSCWTLEVSPSVTSWSVGILGGEALAATQVKHLAAAHKPGCSGGIAIHILRTSRFHLARIQDP